MPECRLIVHDLMETNKVNVVLHIAVEKAEKVATNLGCALTTSSTAMVNQLYRVGVVEVLNIFWHFERTNNKEKRRIGFNITGMNMSPFTLY